MAGECFRFVFFGSAHFAGDVDRLAADRMGAGLRRALGERGSVSGEDRGTGGQLDLAFQVLALVHAREGEPLFPGDAVFGEG